MTKFLIDAIDRRLQGMKGTDKTKMMSLVNLKKALETHYNNAVEFVTEENVKDVLEDEYVDMTEDDDIQKEFNELLKYINENRETTIDGDALFADIKRKGVVKDETIVNLCKLYIKCKEDASKQVWGSFAKLSELANSVYTKLTKNTPEEKR